MATTVEEGEGRLVERRKQNPFQRLSLFWQVVSISVIIIGSVFAGGALTARTFDEFAVLPGSVRANAAGIIGNAQVIDTVRVELDAVESRAVALADSTRDFTMSLFLYLVCLQREGDGRCNYVLPEDVNRRLNEILASGEVP